MVDPSHWCVSCLVLLRISFISECLYTNGSIFGVILGSIDSPVGQFDSGEKNNELKKNFDSEDSLKRLRERVSKVSQTILTASRKYVKDKCEGAIKNNADANMWGQAYLQLVSGWQFEVSVNSVE